MDFIYRSAAPFYKGCEANASQASTRSRPGFWSGLVLGGARPAYRLSSGTATAVQVSRPWWDVMSQAPQYKAAPVFQPADAETDPAGCDEAEATYWRDDWRRQEDEDEVDVALREIRIR